MKLNVKEKIYTHEGARASLIGPEQELRRSVMACMLWEDQFYEDGKSIADRIKGLVAKCRPDYVAACAFEARTKMKLRHVPLLLVREMARLPQHKKLVSKLLPDVIQRADEITEFLAIYWKDGKQPISAQVKKGLSKAFNKFSEYDLAKYNRDGSVTLRDALFLSHAKPLGADKAKFTKEERKLKKSQLNRKLTEKEKLFKAVVENTLKTPDTWEVALSTGEDKKEAFLRLMAEGKLGALAFIRNLRNMSEAGIDKSAVAEYASKVKVERVLPFRFIAAARHVPHWEDVIEPMMLKCMQAQDKLQGKTALLVDHSGSMREKVSDKSEISRFDAASALAILLREICDEVRIFTFSDGCIEVAPRRGFAMHDAITNVINPTSTLLGKAVNHIYSVFPSCERLIVITDEQSQDRPGNPQGTGYVINVGSYKNGIGYGAWVHMDGWSEAVIDFIREYELG